MGKTLEVESGRDRDAVREWISRADVESVLREAHKKLREEHEGDPFKFSDEGDPKEVERARSAAIEWQEKYKGLDPHLDNTADLLSALPEKESDEKEKKAA